MTQLGLFDHRPLPPNPFKPGSQNSRLYERVKLGAVTNGEIIYGMRIANSTGRASEIREFLAPYGFHLDCRRVDGSEFVYEIREASYAAKTAA